jgi:uncharacterized protein YyaL (SSP411 family)
MMNKYYINIKVDREERPDVDRMYMTYLQVSLLQNVRLRDRSLIGLVWLHCLTGYFRRRRLAHVYLLVSKVTSSGLPHELTFLVKVLTPTLEPVFAGTYFPRGKFMGLLDKISEL